MPLPRLLLIDDEPALAAFVAKAADMCGFEPLIAEQDQQFRDKFREHRPQMVALDLGMPGMDGVELLRFLADEDYREPVLIISGFDRRVLESAFRLGSALGLQMVGPIEKPARLEELEAILNELRPSLRAMIAQADLGLLDGFERALINGRLRMVYQPKVSLTDGRLRRVEALVRWDDPELGAISPSRFVPLAEKHGLIDQLTQWGLRTTLRQWLGWREDGLDTCLAFNISALSLDHLDFPDLVERMCRALEVPTDRLVLELTEGATQPLVKLMDTLTRFRIKGIGLAIDDFGVGYSTLMQLRQLPFTELKIDRFFIEDAPISNGQRADRQKHHRSRARPWPHRHRRGHRDRGAVEASARTWLRRRPGLFRRPAAGAGQAQGLDRRVARAMGESGRRANPNYSSGRDVKFDALG